MYTNKYNYNEYPDFAVCCYIFTRTIAVVEAKIKESIK
jgi:hypothetical protein